MTTPEVADYLGKKVATIYDWRTVGYGPKCLKVGRDLRWRRSDVDAWLDEQAS